MSVIDRITKSKATKAGIGYTVGNILVKGINFVSLPVFSRLLSTEEFGIYNIFIAYDAILYVILGMALHSSVKSAFYEYKKIDEYVSSISLIYLINMGISFVLITVFRGWLISFTGLSWLILYLLIIYSVSTALITLYNNKLSLEYAYKKYLCIGLINSIGNVGLSLLFILYLPGNDKAFARIAAVSLVVLLIAMYILYVFYKKERPRYNKKYWKFAVDYSSPIIAHGLSQVVLAQSDRIMIQHFIGYSAAGIYGLAGNVQLVLEVISTSIATVWSTWFFEKIDGNKIDEIKKSSSQLLIFFECAIVGIMAIAPELIYILGGEKYNQSKYIAIPMVISAFVIFAYNVIVPSEYYTKKTKYIMWGTIAAASINIVANYIFIRKHGIVAAAYTTLFSYIIYLLMHVVISKRLIKFNVLSIRLLIGGFVVALFCMCINLIFVESMLVRYTFGAIVEIAMLAALYCIKRKNSVKE